MAHVNPTWPNSGDHGWASQMNTGLGTLVDQGNGHDDILTLLFSGIDGGSAGSLFTGSPTFDGGGAGTTSSNPLTTELGVALSTESGNALTI